MIPDRSRWRSPEPYTYIERLSPPELAWEWLRRNEAYQQDFTASQTSGVTNPKVLDALRNKWGLRCPAVASNRRKAGEPAVGSRHTNQRRRRRQATRRRAEKRTTFPHRAAGGRIIG